MHTPVPPTPPPPPPPPLPLPPPTPTPLQAKFQTYGKQAADIAKMGEFNRVNAVIPPPRRDGPPPTPAAIAPQEETPNYKSVGTCGGCGANSGKCRCGQPKPAANAEDARAGKTLSTIAELKAKIAELEKAGDST